MSLAVGATSPTLRGAFSQWFEWARWVSRKGGEAVPDMAIVWGITAITVAFLLLGTGLAVSMGRSAAMKNEEGAIPLEASDSV